MNFLVKSWIFRHFFEILLLILSILERCSLSCLLYTSDIEAPFRYTMLSFTIAYNHDSCNADPVSRHTLAYIISVSNQMISSCYLTTWNLLWILLNFHILNIHYLTVWHRHKRILGTSLVFTYSTHTNRRYKRMLSRVYVNKFYWLAISAFYLKSRCFYKWFGRTNNYSLNNEKFLNICTDNLS